MAQTRKKSARNQSMELCKLLSASLVIVTHFPFPGEFGSMLCYLSRFAVPTFFCISGYFNYRATTAQVGRRLIHIIKLTALAFFLCLSWGMLAQGFASVWDIWHYLNRGARALMEILFLQGPYYWLTPHLWYLLSLIVVYFALWVYTSFRGEEDMDYGPAYAAGASLFAVYFALAYLLPLDWVQIPDHAYRNGWLTGIPMFLMGIFLHEYQDRIWTNFHLSTGKLFGLLMAGFVFAFLDWKAGLRSEIPLGSMLQVPVLLLLMVRYPTVPIRGKWFQSLVTKLGTISTAMYVLHMVMQDVYDRYLMKAAESLLVGAEPWLRPILLVMLSFLAAVVWERIEWLLNQRKKKK